MLVGEELDLVAGKRGATKLGFALLLRFYSERGRFPWGRGESDAAVDYVARQVAVGATEIAFYRWSGRTIEFHRAQIRKALGFREGSVADAEPLAEWLVTNVTQSEGSGERVREQSTARCRDERIEPPTKAFDRIIRSALSRGVAEALDLPSCGATSPDNYRRVVWFKQPLQPAGSMAAEAGPHDHLLSGLPQ